MYVSCFRIPDLFNVVHADKLKICTFKVRTIFEMSSIHILDRAKRPTIALVYNFLKTLHTKYNNYDFMCIIPNVQY